MTRFIVTSVTQANFQRIVKICKTHVKRREQARYKQQPKTKDFSYRINTSTCSQLNRLNQRLLADCRIAEFHLGEQQKDRSTGNCSPTSRN